MSGASKFGPSTVSANSGIGSDGFNTAAAAPKGTVVDDDAMVNHLGNLVQGLVVVREVVVMKSILSKIMGAK